MIVSPPFHDHYNYQICTLVKITGLEKFYERRACFCYDDRVVSLSCCDFQESFDSSRFANSQYYLTVCNEYYSPSMNRRLTLNGYALLHFLIRCRRLFLVRPIRLEWPPSAQA